MYTLNNVYIDRRKSGLCLKLGISAELLNGTTLYCKDGSAIYYTAMDGSAIHYTAMQYTALQYTALHYTIHHLISRRCTLHWKVISL